MTDNAPKLKYFVIGLISAFILAMAIHAMGASPKAAQETAGVGQIVPAELSDSTAAVQDEMKDTAVAVAQKLARDVETYETAVSLLYSRDFDNSIPMLEGLGEFRDSAALAAWAEDYRAQEPEYGAAILDEAYVDRVYPDGTLYSLSSYGTAWGNYSKFRGLVYVPFQVDEDTSFVQYFAGGGDGNDWLWYEGVYGYFDDYFPNAIIVFTNESAHDHIQQRLDMEWDILRQLAYECGTVVHDLSAIGSSNGSYAAMRMAYDYYAHHGIALKSVCTLDTGVSWDLKWMSISYEEALLVAEAGTELYFFEGPGFQDDLQKDAVQAVINAGVDATALICNNEDHNAISRNAYTLGVFQLSAGEDMELPAFEYYPVELVPGITTIGEPSWPEQPASDGRRVYSS